MKKIQVSFREKLDLLLRQSSLIFIFIITFSLSAFFVFLINFFVYQYNPEKYIDIIKKYNLLFNFPYASLIFIINSIIYAFYLYTEAQMHFQKHKLVFKDDETRDIFGNTFIIISILFTYTFFFITISIFIGYSDYMFSNILLFFRNFLLILMGIVLIIYLYFANIIKYFLYLCLLINNFFYSFNRRGIDNLIFESKTSEKNLVLILLKILNLKEVSKKLRKSKKYIIWEVIKNIKTRLTTRSNLIIPVSYKKGLIGLLNNYTNANAETLTIEKIKPYLENVLIIDSQTPHIQIDYKIINISDNNKINNVVQFLSYLKKNPYRNINTKID